MALSARARMEALVKAQTTQQLVEAWKPAAERWAAAEAGDDVAGPLMLSMLAIEFELFHRGQPFCEACGGPCGLHVPVLCDAIQAAA